MCAVCVRLCKTIEIKNRLQKKIKFSCQLENAAADPTYKAATTLTMAPAGASSGKVKSSLKGENSKSKSGTTNQPSKMLFV